MKAIVEDKNVIAQEKGMEAILVWVDRAPIAVRNPASLIAKIVEKCLPGRPNTKASAQKILLAFIERDLQDIVLVGSDFLFDFHAHHFPFHPNPGLESERQFHQNIAIRI